MKSKLALIFAAGALVAGALQSEAAPITGALGITGTFSADVPVLSSATTISILTASVDTVNGDLASTISLGDAVAVASPIAVGANGPIAIPAGSIWTVGGFSLDLTSLSQVFESFTQLNLSGLGTISGNGFDPTPGDFQMAFTRSGRGVTAALTFSATSAAVPPVPDGGATAMLLGLGVLGMAGLRRKLS